jgi:hypothetical protein
MLANSVACSASLCLQICGELRQTDRRPVCYTSSHTSLTQLQSPFGCAVQRALPDVSKDRSASFFSGQTVQVFDSSTMSIKALGSFETSNNTHPKTNRHITKHLKATNSRFLTWNIKTLKESRDERIMLKPQVGDYVLKSYNFWNHTHW